MLKCLKLLISIHQHMLFGQQINFFHWKTKKVYTKMYFEMDYLGPKIKKRQPMRALK